MTGKLAVKNGYYVIYINYKDEDNNYRRTQITTNLPERGNKKAAKQLLDEALKNFKIKETKPKKSVEEQNVKTDNTKFVDYVENYILGLKDKISPSTLESYKSMFKTIKQYFGKDKLLKDITHQDIQDFYDFLKKERNDKNRTLKHYSNVISPAMRIAYRDDLIPKNPFEFLPKLKVDKRKFEYYNKDELEKLFEITDKTNIGLIVRIAAYYGFRRSELLGLQWHSIDFQNKTITIQNKIIFVEKTLTEDYILKTYASPRTLPLMPEIEKLLLKRKEEIEINKKLYGKSYNMKFNDYVFVDDIGNLFLPDYISSKFANIIKKNKLKHIRFHDLRHSCASLLLANKVPMKNIQEWLGHANFNTTADVYSHLDYSSKLESASVIANQLSNSSIEEKDVEELELEVKRLNELIALKKSLTNKKSKERNRDGQVQT